jgi:hypothetical protein
MNKRAWSYLQNQFESCTDGNYKKGMLINTYLDASLNAAKADAAILVLYNYYHPIYAAYQSAYDAWVAQGGTQKGSTATLTQLLEQSTEKVNAWEYAILGVFAKGSPQYITLFPKGKSPYNKGSQESRMAAFNALNINLTGIAALASTKTAVDAYYNSLIAANTEQKGSKSTTDMVSNTVETERLNMCKGQYYVLGGLMQKYIDDTTTIGNYFDLETIRRSAQTEFTGHLAPLELKVLAKRTFAPTDELRIANKGESILKFYLQLTDGSAEPTLFVQLDPISEQTFSANQLGDVESMHYLTVLNTDPAVEGQYIVDLL